MKGGEAWLGLCHLYEGEGDARISYEAHAAVWCAGPEDFDAALRTHLAGSAQQLLWSEEVYPAVQWHARFRKEHAALALARKVHPARAVALGALKAPNAPEPSRIVEEIKGVEPLDSQFGVWPKKTVPEALREALFGQGNPSKAEIAQYGSHEAVPPMRTYAILDAAKAPLLPELLASSGVAYRCLFKGDAEVRLRKIAPYAVALEEDNVLTRQLFTHSGMPADLWLKDTGFYVRSRDDLGEIWRHFRKFTRVQDENGSWLFFRFWETTIRPVFLKPRKDDSIFAKLTRRHSFVLRSRDDPTLFHHLR